MELGEEKDVEELIHANRDTQLLGAKGHLDSLGVVMLVSEVEGLLSEELDKDIIIADDRAMSRQTSPFRSVKTLCAYIEELLAEEDK